MQLKNQDNKHIKTNQSFVHIKHSITIRQYKYWHLLIKFFSEQIAEGIEPDADGFYYESRSKISEHIGYELMTKELKTDVEALRKEPIIINYLEKDGQPAIHGMGFISEYKITSAKVGFRLPSFIEKVIRGENESRKLFLLLNWNIFNSFNGKYEAIIYKLCKDYVGIGRTPYFNVEEYRDYIGLMQNEYSENKSMFRRCINEPIKKINDSEICDIKVSVDFKKVGKNIVGLNFIVESKKQDALSFNESFEEPTPSPVFKLAKISISLRDQQKYLELFETEEIEASIERANIYIDSLKANGKENITMGAIYRKSISENWGKSFLEEKLMKEQAAVEAKAKHQRKLDHENKKISDQKRKEENSIAKDEKLLNDFESYSFDIQKHLVDEVLNKNKNVQIVYKPLKKAFEEHGIQAYKHSPVFKGLLLKEIVNYKTKENLKNLLVSFENMDDEEKVNEILYVLKLNPTLQPIYEKFGISAYNYDENFKSFLIQHLSLKQIVSNL